MERFLVTTKVDPYIKISYDGVWNKTIEQPWKKLATLLKGWWVLGEEINKKTWRFTKNEHFGYRV